jgi:predicted MPP superfamily phosphohydrolase
MKVLIGGTIAMHVPFVLAAVDVGKRIHLPVPWLLSIVLASLLSLFFVSWAKNGMYDVRKSPSRVWLVDVPYFVHWCACLLALAPSILGSILIPIITTFTRGHPTLPLDFFMWTYAIAFVVSAYGVLVRRRWFHVDEIDIPVAGLNPAFDGYRIAHLSDLHIGTLTPRAWGMRWTKAANGRAPDLAVVTGDLVTSGTVFHQDIADVIGSLKAKDGVFVSMGNHDYFGDGDPLVTLLNSTGARVLRNEGRVLERGGAQLYLAAIDDTWTRRDDIDRALAEKPSGIPTILLAHDPAAFPDATERNVEVTLSGHTHGGQLAIPFFARWLSLSHIAHRFHLGLYTKNRSTLYVHPGLGTTGPPIRIGVAPAVAILRLRAT